MSEKFSGSQEHFKAPESTHSPEHHAEHKTPESSTTPETHRNAEHIKHLQNKAMHEAEKSESASRASENSSNSVSNNIPLATKHLKDQKYAHTLASVRRRLRGPDKPFSRVIHSKALETISEQAETTVARPSALLGGGIAAFLISTIAYYFANHYGWEYNPGVLIFSFVGGYFIGIVIELLLRQAYRKSS